MLKLKQFMALMGLTAVEAVRQPICLLLTITCVLATALTPILMMYHFGEDGRLARDSGLAFHFVFGLFVAGYAACSSVSREMSSGTASAVLSKPVDKAIFLTAKFAGIVAVLIAFSICASAATLLSERVAEKFVFTAQRSGYITDWQTGNLLLAVPFVACLVAGLINFKTRRPFQSMAFGLLILCLLLVFFISGFFDRTGALQPFDFAVKWSILPASILITMALVVLSAIAIAIATRLSTIPTLTICSGIFLLGLVSDFVFGRHVDQSGLAAFLHGIIPSWQHFWMSDALVNGGTVPPVYMLQAGLYALVYTAAALCFGIASFRHAEMK